jgi:hypothetical protein
MLHASSAEKGVLYIWQIAKRAHGEVALEIPVKYISYM